VSPRESSPAEAVERELDRAIVELGLRGHHVLVAASGGLDSTVLAHALTRLRPSGPACVSLGHVNHGLRGAEAEADEAAVRALARRLGVACRVRHVAPGELRSGRSSRDRPTPQEAARTVRYGALREMAHELRASRLATAHHADDQAETVMLRLLRGTGPDGLGGIPERSEDGFIVRPLLRLPRAALEAYARHHGLDWREDASNESPAYARNRLRRELPSFARGFNPQWLRAIVEMAEAQRRDSEWIAGRVAAEAECRFSVEDGWLRIDAKDFRALPEALSRRLAREALARCGVARLVTRVHLERIQEFLGSARVGTRLELPGGIRLLREHAGFRLGPCSGGRQGAC